MKTIAQTVRNIDTAQEQWFLCFQKSLISHAELTGQQHGTVNIPKTAEEWRARYVNGVEAKVQEALHYNHQVYLPISKMLVAGAKDKQVREETARIIKELHDDEHREMQLNQQKDSLKPRNQRKAKLKKTVLPALIFLAVSEGWFCMEALQQSMPMIAAIITSIGLAIAIGLGVHFGARLIRRPKKLFDQFILFGIACLVSSVLFATLGYLRQRAYTEARDVYLNAQSAASDTMGEWWAIALLSFILFAAALAFCCWIYQTTDELKEADACDGVCSRIAEVKARIAAKNQEIADLKQAANDEKAQALIQLEHASTYERRLIGLATMALEAYKERNLRHRTDDMCPPFFAYPFVFNFTTFFDTVKNNIL